MSSLTLFQLAKQRFGILMVAVFCFIFGLGCSTSNSKEDQQTVSEKDHASDTVYNYEPTVSTLSGTVKESLFYGPPGYGEDTINDSKERVYVLVLDKPITMIAEDKNEFNTAKTNIKEIQLVTNEDFKHHINKKITLSGTLFGAQTGHHHTDVLLQLKNNNESQSALSIDTFATISPEVLGTYCYYSFDKKDYDANEWIFIDGNDSLGYLKLNKAICIFKLIKTEPLGKDKTKQYYTSNNYNMTIEYANKKRTGEMLMRTGVITINSNDGTSTTTTNFYGGCGS